MNTPNPRPQDAPDELIAAASRAITRAADERDPGEGIPTWDALRVALAAVIPEVERRVREQVADQIEAEDSDPGSGYERGLRVAASIVRGESPVTTDPAPPAGRNHAEWLVAATANLDAYIQEKATAIAAARIAAIEDKAEQEMSELMAGHVREVQRLEDLIKELRRQLKPLVRHIEQECPATLERKARIKARMEQARQNR